MTWHILWSGKSRIQLNKPGKKTAKRVIDGVKDTKKNPYTAAGMQVHSFSNHVLKI